VIGIATGLTGGFFVLCDGMEVQLESTLAVPTLNAGGIAVHQGIIRDITGHHRAGTHKAVASEGDTAHHGGIGANRCAIFHQGGFVFIFADDVTARVDHVGEDHRITPV